MTDARTNDLVAKLEDLIKQATTERSHFYVAATAGEAVREIQKLRDALLKAVEVIKVWHNMGGNDGVWKIYWRSAPEMKPIREALTALRGVAP